MYRGIGVKKEKKNKMKAKQQSKNRQWRSIKFRSVKSGGGQFSAEISRFVQYTIPVVQVPYSNSAMLYYRKHTYQSCAYHNNTVLKIIINIKS